MKNRYIVGEIARSEEVVPYSTESDDSVIARAITILENRMRLPGDVFTSPTDVKNYLRLTIGHLPHETFVVLFLDAQHRLIECQHMFRGTLTQTSVYPREVVKAALEQSAAAVILAHNHPSGSVQPSQADEALTQTLKSALALVDVRVIDHIIISASDSLSMAEKGIL